MLKEHNHQFEVEEVSINSDSSRHMSSPMSMPMTKNSEAAVVVVPEKRRRFTAQEKVELVRLSYLPGNTVSSVARQYGVSPALLFRWRALDKTGGLVAVETGENTVPASKYAEALDEIKRLQRLLGQATADNALLKDAVEIMQSKKWIAR